QGWWEVGYGQNPILLCIGPQEDGPHSYSLGIRVTVTNGTQTASTTRWVTVSLPNGMAYPCSGI
ncbi:MAG TPA: hypothetical protein VFQ45_06640, partial [Longimicrobium sp.]|nr:hypothetical protein [Longimicrobium sp.]